MAFPEAVKKEAFERAGGRCEGTVKTLTNRLVRCNAELDYNNHDKGEVGAWHAHHKKSRKRWRT